MGARVRAEVGVGVRIGMGRSRYNCCRTWLWASEGRGYRARAGYEVRAGVRVGSDRPQPVELLPHLGRGV